MPRTTPAACTASISIAAWLTTRCVKCFAVRSTSPLSTAVDLNSLTWSCASSSTDADAEISTLSFEAYLIWYMAVALEPLPAPSDANIALPLVQPATTLL